LARIGNSRLQRRICGRVLHDQTCSQHQLSCYTLLSPPHIFKREHDAGSTVQLSRYPLHKLLGYGQIVPEHTLKMCINGSRAHVAVWNSREARIRHIGRSRGYSPRGDLRTPPERAGRTTSIEVHLCACASQSSLAFFAIDNLPAFRTGLRYGASYADALYKQLKIKS